MKDTKIQWHPAFVAAMGLELKQNRNDLIFEKEYNLNTKPLEIDLLVIKKESSVQLTNEIGKFFRGHNIVEYKSPEDHLDIDTFYKTGAYASLYKSYGKTVDSIKADAITVSIVREVKPIVLFRYFQEHGFEVENYCPGIYYVRNNVLFPTQIIVTRELCKSDHVWLRFLSERLKKQDVIDFLENVRQLSDKEDQELADSVLEVGMEANKQIIEELIGDENMYETLMEIMEPRIQQREKAKIEAERKKGIRLAVKSLQDLGTGTVDIKKVIIKNYGLSEEETEEFL